MHIIYISAYNALSNLLCSIKSKQDNIKLENKSLKKNSLYQQKKTAIVEKFSLILIVHLVNWTHTNRLKKKNK